MMMVPRSHLYADTDLSSSCASLAFERPRFKCVIFCVCLGLWETWIWEGLWHLPLLKRLWCCSSSLQCRSAKRTLWFLSASYSSSPWIHVEIISCAVCMFWKNKMYIMWFRVTQSLFVTSETLETLCWFYGNSHRTFHPMENIGSVLIRHRRWVCIWITNTDVPQTTTWTDAALHHSAGQQNTSTSWLRSRMNSLCIPCTSMCRR